MLNFENYKERPPKVKAVKITNENIEQCSKLVKGDVVGDKIHWATGDGGSTPIGGVDDYVVEDHSGHYRLVKEEYFLDRYERL